MTENNKKTANDAEFNVGDQVRVKQRIPFYVASIGMIGVVVGITNKGILVKFDNFMAGHHGGTYFRANNMGYDKKDTSHLYVPSHQLEKVEKEIKFAHNKLLDLGYIVKVSRKDFVQYELIISEDKFGKYSNLIHICFEDDNFMVWRRFDSYYTGGAVAEKLFDEDLEKILLEYLGELK